MAFVTRLVVIYATGSKILRRKIFVDDDSHLDLHQPGAGESRLLLLLSGPFDDAACRAAIAAATGVEPPSGRCCIVDDEGSVVGVCNADPALDAHPAGQLVAHDLAGPGDRYRYGVFIRDYAIADDSSRQASTSAWLPIDNPLALTATSILQVDRCDKDEAGSPRSNAAATL